MSLFSWIEDEVNEVLGGVTQVTSALTDEIGRPVRSMAEEVLGGIWKGKGAEAFVKEINDQFLPMLTGMTGRAETLNKYINQSRDVISQADTEAAGIASSLNEPFSF
jgi:hypothetical protein